MKKKLTALLLATTMSFALGNLTALANEVPTTTVLTSSLSDSEGITYDLSKLQLVQYDSQGNIVPMLRNKFDKITLIAGGTLEIKTDSNGYFYCTEDSTATIKINFSKGKNGVVGYKKKGESYEPYKILSGKTNRYSVPITIPSTGYYYFYIENNTSDDITIAGSVTIK